LEKVFGEKFIKRKSKIIGIGGYILDSPNALMKVL